MSAYLTRPVLRGCCGAIDGFRVSSANDVSSVFSGSAVPGSLPSYIWKDRKRKKKEEKSEIEASDLIIKTTYKIGDGGLGRNRYNHSGIHHLIRVVRVVQRHNLIGRNTSTNKHM